MSITSLRLFTLLFKKSLLRSPTRMIFCRRFKGHFNISMKGLKNGHPKCGEYRNFRIDMFVY